MEENNNFKDRIKYIPGQEEIEEKLQSFLDEYSKSNSFETREYLCYLTAAIFLTYKKLFPQLGIYIPFRTKSDMSFINNLKKEMGNIIKIDEDNNVSFDDTPVLKDLSGFKIILDNINYSVPPKGETELFKDPKIKKLQKDSQKNLEFVESIDEYIQAPIHNGKQYFELKKELLEKIIKITPPEFTEETLPDPSFKELYEKTIAECEYFSAHDGYPSKVEKYIPELADLSKAFRRRIYDQFQFAILEKTLPIVFEAPLIKNALKASSHFEKHSKKANAFEGLYYIFNTPFGLIEAQAQSDQAHYKSTRGSAYHSGMDGKTINIEDFFELVNPDDEHSLSYYTERLDSISADKIISPYELPEFETEDDKKLFLNSEKGQQFLNSEEYEKMMKHIKIKQILQFSTDQNAINTDDFLLSMALSLSPYMNVCSSGHTSFTTASIHHQKIIGEFSEVLRKKDSNTCLRNMLIRRLEQIIEDNTLSSPDSSAQISKNMKRSLDLVQEHRKMATTLPKDISKKNIIRYVAETLIEKEGKTEEPELF